MAALAGAAAISIAALTGCGGDSGASSTGSGSATATSGVVSGTTTGDGTMATVTLANGATEEVSVYRSESGTVINETLGRTFAVSLPQSPSTGYSWKASGGTAPGAIVELQGDEVTTDDAVPGSPGTHLFVYRASGEGEGSLEFAEYPPGSDTASTMVTFEVSVGAP